MFGFSTALRSATQGKAEFTMEFAGYERCPQSVLKELIEAHQKAKAS
jgi:elongation factor G